ncbi:19115_t:CDS:1, partial [Funneliformis geosporum]
NLEVIKKDTTYKLCDKVCVNPNKLREHLKRKNPCRPQTNNQEAIQETIQPSIQETIQPSIQTPFQAPIQKDSQQHILTTEPKPIKVSSKYLIKILYSKILISNGVIRK